MIRTIPVLSFFGISASDHNVYIIKKFARKFPKVMIGSDWYRSDEINEISDICSTVLSLQRGDDYDRGEMERCFGQFKTLVRRMLRASGVEYAVVEA